MKKSDVSCYSRRGRQCKGYFGRGCSLCGKIITGELLEQQRDLPPSDPPSDDALAELAHKIRHLDPSDQLRLAAELLEARKPDVALAIIKKIHDELEVLHLQGLF